MVSQSGWVGFSSLFNPPGIGPCWAGVWVDVATGRVVAIDAKSGDRSDLTVALQRALDAGHVPPARLFANAYDLEGLWETFPALTFVEAGAFQAERHAAAMERHFAPWPVDHWGALLPRALVHTTEVAARALGTLPWVERGQSFHVHAPTLGLSGAMACVSFDEGPLFRLAPSSAAFDEAREDALDMRTPILVLADRAEAPVGPMLARESADGVLMGAVTQPAAETCLAVLKALHAAAATGAADVDGVRVEACAEPVPKREGFAFHMDLVRLVGLPFLVDVARTVGPRPRARLGRNERCWCGSGRKYKACHLDNDVAARARCQCGRPRAPVAAACRRRLPAGRARHGRDLPALAS